MFAIATSFSSIASPPFFPALLALGSHTFAIVKQDNVNVRLPIKPLFNLVIHNTRIFRYNYQHSDYRGVPRPHGEPSVRLGDRFPRGR